MKNWIINFLGGHTEAQMNEFKDKCASFAQENLCGKNGEISPDVSFYFPYDHDNIIILRSSMIVMDGLIDSLVFAPWCRNVKAKLLKIKGSCPSSIDVQ